MNAALRRFHPRVREWFHETLGAPSAPQEKGWPAIAEGEHTLILAPTGTGKTAAVEQLRATASADDTPTVIAATDPANVWSLPLSIEPGLSPDAFARPRGARALLVTRAGRVIMTSDAHGRAVHVRDDLNDAGRRCGRKHLDQAYSRSSRPGRPRRNDQWRERSVEPARHCLCRRRTACKPRPGCATTPHSIGHRQERRLSFGAKRRIFQDHYSIPPSPLPPSAFRPG